MWADRGEGGSALDFSAMSLAADSGAFWGCRRNLQGVSFEFSVTSFLTFMFCDKHRYKWKARNSVLVYMQLRQHSHMFLISCKHPLTHISSSIQVHMSGIHSLAYTHTPFEYDWKTLWVLLAAELYLNSLYMRMLFIILTQILYWSPWMLFPKARLDSHHLVRPLITFVPHFSLLTFSFLSLSPLSVSLKLPPPPTSCLSSLKKNLSKALGSLPLIGSQGCSWPYICRKSTTQWLMGPTRSQAQRAHLSLAQLWPSQPDCSGLLGGPLHTSWD